MARTKIKGYAPDMDPTEVGVLVNCANAVPSAKGMQGAPAPVTTPLAALAAACVGAAIVRKLDDTTRFFAGTSTKLYEAATTTWTDVSRGASTYTAIASGARWSFAQYGNVSLAVQKSDLLQFSTSGAFANVVSSPQAVPKASIVETVGQFVFLFDTTEATYGDSPDRWWCSASGNYADWNPSTTTECATGRLISSPGVIRGAKRFGEQIAVYKTRGMYLGTYQGSPSIWRFDEMPGEAGAASNDAIVNIGTGAYPKHLFMGLDDFYSFDGSRPTPIGVGWVKKSVFSEISYANIKLCATLHDPVNSRVYFYYPTESTLTKCVVYNYLTKQWGRDDRSIECAANYISSGISYGDLGTYYATYADLPQVPYGTSFLVAGATAPAIFNTSHQLQTLNGTSSTSSITTGDLGDEQNLTLVTRVRPLFLVKPTTSNVINYYRNNLGDTLTAGQTSSFADGKYDFIRSARWHRIKFNFAGDWEMGSFNVYANTEGEA